MKGGDKSPPRNEVTGVKGDLFAKYHRGLHALRPKASADYVNYCNSNIGLGTVFSKLKRSASARWKQLRQRLEPRRG